MQHLKPISIIFLTLFHLIPFVSSAQFADFKLSSPESLGFSEDSLQKMNVHFHNLVDDKQIAGVQAAIIRKGELVHFDSYGYSDIEEKMELNEHSIFRIFSMTKPIVSLGLMQLYEKGMFELDDPLYKYIPWFKEMYIHSDSTLTLAKNPILIIDLLRHTSGFNYGRGSNQNLNQLYVNAELNLSKDNKEHVEKLSKLPLQFEPGTDWQYSVSTNICGYLIEVLSGKSLDVYLEETIFQPLGMTNTFFQVPKDRIDDFTVGYGWNDEDGLIVSEIPEKSMYAREVTFFRGGGGLLSTTLDYLKFCRMLLNDGQVDGKQIIKAETLAIMWEDHLKEVRKYQNRVRLPLGEGSFGLGFSIKGDNSEELESVYGWGGAVGTYFRIEPEKNLAYVLMIQLSPYRQLGLRRLFQDYVNSAILE